MTESINAFFHGLEVCLLAALTFMFFDVMYSKGGDDE